MDSTQFLKQRDDLVSGRDSAILADTLSERDKLARNRAAMAQALTASDNLNPSGKQKVWGAIDAEFQTALSALRKRAESELAAERQRLDSAMLKARAAAITRDRGLYSAVPAAELAVMTETIRGATIAELTTWYDALSVDPAAALVARRLIGAHLAGRTFEMNESMTVGSLERRLEVDQEKADSAVTALQAELASLAVDEKLLAQLDPAGRAADLTARYNISQTAPPLEVPSDLTKAERDAARVKLQMMIAGLK